MAEATEMADRPIEVEVGENAEAFARAKAVGAGDEGRELLEHAAMGADLTAAEEHTALDWLLGTPAPSVHDIPVDYDTPEGTQKLTFTVKSMDGRRLDTIEQKHRNPTSGNMDVLSANCQLVAEATMHLTDRSGKQTKLTDDAFLTVPIRQADGSVVPTRLADPAMALERRFRTQLGLISGIAVEIRRVSGFDPERVGAAQRRLVEASLG